MRLQSHNIFWRRIHKSAKNKGFPLRVMFELTYRCNFFCRHCYIPFNFRKKSAKEELKTKDVFSILDQLRDMGCFYLGFTGGEPFIREDIIDILWYAKRSGFEIIIYTNGSMIDKKVADELADIKPNKVDITIPAISENAFKRISGVCGSRNKVFKTIELLDKKGINLGFKTCLLKENKLEIKQIENFADSLGALHRLDDMLLPRLDGLKKPYLYRPRLKKERVTGFKSPVTSKNRDEVLQCNSTNPTNSTNSTNPTNPINLFNCGVGKSQVAITPFGELKMCLMIDYPKYKILKTSLKEAWNKLKDLVSNIKPDKNYRCGKCSLQNYCKWCPAKGWLEKKSFTACDSESLRQAELWRNRYANTYSSADCQE